MSEEQKKPKATKKKKCFIITPIGENGSETFRMAKGVIESVIKPVLKRNGFEDIKPAYEILDSGMIGNQIVDRIVNDDLVVANLTGNNPNVMYELAIRHATAKPIIHICEFGTKLPFDIKDNRTIFYKNDMLGTKELEKEFEAYVANVEYLKEYRDNPIYNGLQTGLILKNLNESGKQEEAQLLQQIIDLLSKKNLKEDVQNFARRHSSTMPDMMIDVSCISDDTEFNLFMKELSVLTPEIKIRNICHLKDKTKIYLDLEGSQERAINEIDSLSKKYNVTYNVLLCH